MVEKLNVKLKDLKEHNSTLFPSNWIALKQGEKLNLSTQIECVEVLT